METFVQGGDWTAAEEMFSLIPGPLFEHVQVSTHPRTPSSPPSLTRPVPSPALSLPPSPLLFLVLSELSLLRFPSFSSSAFLSCDSVSRLSLQPSLPTAATVTTPPKTAARVRM
eukprot:732699-Hanusia_phi.AAC.1